MANKKGQHLVPACYLRSFIADIPESEVNNPRFQAGVYVNSKFLDAEWKMRGIHHSIFKKSYYYTLPYDNPDQPFIENYLSSVENSYRKYLKKLEAREISNEVLSYLSYFTTLQYMRVEKHISSFQDVWNKIGERQSQFIGDSQYRKQLANVAKELIPVTDLGWVLHPHAIIIYNNTNFPFMTSDNPVIRKNINKEDLELVVPKSLINDTFPESKESALFFFPLTPNIAYVSCELIQSGVTIDFDEGHLSEIFYINYWCLLNAHEYVYSSIKEPLKSEKEISNYLKSDKSCTYLKIYTEDYRIKTEGRLLDSDQNTISFICNDRQDLTKLMKGMYVSLSEVIDNGVSVRGLRDCTVKKTNIDTGLVIIESKLK